jgi:hypothetical protein
MCVCVCARYRRNYRRSHDFTQGVHVKHKKRGMFAKYIKAHPILEKNQLVNNLTSFCGAKNATFLRHLYIKTNILPRQARDKHRESTQKKEWRFVQGWSIHSASSAQR